MSDMTTLTGVVATIPDHRITSNGLAITSFRLASSHRRFDKEKKSWVDGETNWYTVSTFRHLAFNTAHSLRKGEHILVTGRLHIRNWAKDDRKGTNIELEADAIGHDLFWCTTSFARSAPQSSQQPYSDRYGAESNGAESNGVDSNGVGSDGVGSNGADSYGAPNAPFEANTGESPATSADWMANPDRDSVGWATVDPNASAPELDESDALIDPDPDDPFDSSDDGFLPASEAGMATIDS